ncbi:MAG: glycoside hydrolase family 13 protein [Bifidobacteriaceae bacterium]|jgi:alpha-glucosidase|nr:glycoside hydrolase family 13 protein [Bifidobacteriaceae bacterium]
MGHTTRQDWWRDAVVYQIYPRSFADANGDGIGDVTGITSRVGYLAGLGIDAVWLSPFYPSQLADGGYDVDNHRDVDPRLGTLEQFDAMVAALHDVGLRLIVDIVPNHTGSGHPWFREALASPRGSRARDRYIFRDAPRPGTDLAPSDWTSLFGGPAWQRVPDGQFYLHYYAVEQPDLNWANPEVRADFIHTLRFWSDRGVDGFRIDVAHGLAKDLSADPLPSQAEIDRIGPGPDHPMWDRDEVHEIYAEWREIFNSYDPPRAAIGEVWVTSPERRARYATPAGLGQAFNFDLLRAPFEAATFRRIVSVNLDQAARAGSTSTWVLSNHDVVRHATRYGLPQFADADQGQAMAQAWIASGGREPPEDRALGLARARAATLFILALPGSAYLYQGEELGLPEVAAIPASARQDPAFFRSGGREIGRDGARVPLPWTRTGPSFGFGTATGHLPQPTWFGQFSVETEETTSASTLAIYRQALVLRKRLGRGEDLEWLDTADDDVLAFRRLGGWTCVTNFAAHPVPRPPGRLLMASGPLEGRGAGQRGMVPPATTVWLIEE